MDDDRAEPAIAVLLSGGIDSAVLTAELRGQFRCVQPIFVRCGLVWEEVELAHLRRFLARLPQPALSHDPVHSVLRALAVLDLPVADVYGDHWALSGQGVPGADTADESVFLPGRNLFLIAKAAVWCAVHGFARLALGTLAGNPFADSSVEFDEEMSRLVRRSLGRPFRIERPYAGLSKAAVIGRGAQLPLEHTFSCICPADALHCGACNKCAERRRGFNEAGVPDRTEYAAIPGRLPRRD